MFLLDLRKLYIYLRSFQHLQICVRSVLLSIIVLLLMLIAVFCCRWS